MYRSILLPLDGSPCAEAAIPAAVSLSRRTGATIRTLSVVESLPDADPYGWREAVRTQTERYLFELSAQIGSAAGSTVTPSVATGRVHAVLEAEAERVDLVVLATHGRGGFSRAWLGSVADRLVRHISQPVLLIRPPEQPKGGPWPEWRLTRVLVPLDGSSDSEAVLPDAVELGMLFGASFVLLRVIPTPKEFSSPYPPHMIRANQERMAAEEAEATRQLRHHVRDLQSRGIKVEERVLLGAQAAHGILQETEAAGCDLIALSPRGRGGAARALLGSTSDKVIRGTHLPLLVHRGGS